MSQTEKKVVDTKLKVAPVNLPEEEFNRTWNREKEFKMIKSLEDPRFGKISVLKNHSTGEVIMAKEKMLDSKPRAQSDILELQQRTKLNHNNMMQLLGYSTSVKKNLCSTHYLSRAFYNYPKTDMERELNTKKAETTEFSGDELQKLGLDSLRGLAHLHQKGLHHGDIRPKYLGYDKVSNTSSLLDRLKDPAPVEVTQRNNLMTPNVKNYMSPQLYKKVQGHDKNQTYDVQKNDMYGLGMSMLELGTMDSVADCYNKDGTMNKAKLDEHLNDFSGKYNNSNPGLVRTVRSLLAENEADRPSSTQLLDQVSTGQFTQNQNTTRVVHSTPPQETFEYQAPKKVETVVHSQPITSNSNDNYFNFVQKPLPNVVHTSYVEPVQTTYVEPQRTYVKSEPTYISQQETRETSYVYTEPSYTTYEQSYIPETYVSTQPQVTYVQGGYTEPKSTYVQGEPVYLRTYEAPNNYSYSTTTEHKVEYVPQNVHIVQPEQPKVEYVLQTEPQYYKEYVPQNVHIVQPEQPKVEYVLQTEPQYYKEYVPQTNYQYVQQEHKVEYVPQTDYQYVQEHKVEYVQPTNYVYSQPTTTYVQSQPTTTYVQPTTTYVQPKTTIVHDNYVVRESNPYVVHTEQPVEKVIRTSYVTQQNYVQSQPQNVYGQTSLLNPNVEIRRTSYIPPQGYNLNDKTTEKTRYIMKEDGTVVEVDPNVDHA
jgi:hypothetical protein